MDLGMDLGREERKGEDGLFWCWALVWFVMEHLFWEQKCFICIAVLGSARVESEPVAVRILQGCIV
jgi:hypothetical protein